MNISDQITWYSERHLLHIDLSSLINTPITLILTSWNHPCGITWALHNAVEQIDELYDDDPFSAPYFPLWERLDYESCRDYLDQIPVEVMLALKPFRSDNFGMLIAVCRHNFLTNFCGNYRVPFWLLYRRAKNEGWIEQQFISLCETGIFNVLKALNLPANQATLELLNKITASHGYTQFHVDLIQQTFRDLDYHHLNSSLETVPDFLLQFLLRYPHLQHVKFLGQLERDDYYVFRDCIKRLRSALIKRDVVNVNQQIATVLAISDSLNALRTYEKRVSDTTGYTALHVYAKSAENSLGDSTAIPQWIK